ncbi:DUF6110 family protein [Slackia heliotrinireducens]|jgi:hypothetical protein|uniref:DUF1490 family protein n=1 Tax=Slackia heliotrinireducens (strain ATCC 29202 / DSM 20476 / NCTC 11029 / RHS 1) TaxID=471855 RepID=C7N3Y9_SLAHD|nr:DUF6110 family protein [Slackia heliotrinireducens]ACV21730.1 hypothetical protein Shel_06710 [Slackia heliotrinireducens DSM 20476]VEG99376.1 Uncharacterised protein [Slackia heliotrinireducens]
MSLFSKTHTLLVAGGFLLGTVGLTALKSETAKKCYVQAAATGMRIKNTYDDVIEQAKAEVDDIVAEATYLTKQDAEAAEEVEAEA